MDADKKKAIQQVREIAFELTTAGPLQPIERGTRDRIAGTLGGESTLVTWHNSLDNSATKTAVGKLISHLAKLYSPTIEDRLTREAFAEAVATAADQIPKICDQIEAIENSKKAKPRKARHDWEKLRAKAIEMFSADRSRLGWSSNHWARELGVPTSTFGDSPLSDELATLGMAEKINKLSNGD